MIDIENKRAFRRNQSKSVPEANFALPNYSNIENPNPHFYREEQYSLEKIPVTEDEISQLKLGKK